MTFREIIEREDQNTDSIWLYREGMFMKAYERSAFFAHTLIHEFKLSKRYIKTVNMDVISLGFPEPTIPRWLNGYVYEWVQDGLLRCHMRKVFDEVEFHNWKEVVTRLTNGPVDLCSEQPAEAGAEWLAKRLVCVEAGWFC